MNNPININNIRYDRHTLVINLGYQIYQENPKKFLHNPLQINMRFDTRFLPVSVPSSLFLLNSYSGLRNCTLCKIFRTQHSLIHTTEHTHFSSTTALKLICVQEYWVFFKNSRPVYQLSRLNRLTVSCVFLFFLYC